MASPFDITPIDAPTISTFQPLPLAQIQRSAQMLQERQDAAVAQLDALQELQDTSTVMGQDQALFNQLVGGVRNSIGEIADAGYIGDRMRQIRGLSRDFRRQYQPFAQSAQNYQKSRQALIEDESLTPAQKQERLQVLNDNVGLRLGADGEIDPASIFQERRFASGVNLNEIVNEQMKHALQQEGVKIVPGATPEQIGLLATKQFTEEQISNIVQGAIGGSPEATAFIQDELAVANARVRRQEGRDMTPEERTQFVNDQFGPAIGTAIQTYGAPQQDLKLQNLPQPKESKAKSLAGESLAFQGNYPVPQMSATDTEVAISNYKARYDQIEKLKNDGSIASETQAEMFEFEQQQLQNQIDEKESLLRRFADEAGIENVDSMINRIGSGGPKLDDFDIDEAEAKKIREMVDTAMGGSTRGPFHANTGAYTGLNAQMSIMDGPYMRAYARWRSEMQGATSTRAKKLNSAAKRVNAQMASQKMKLRSFGSNDDLKKELGDFLVGTGFDSGAQYLDDAFDPFSKGDISIDDIEISGYSLMPDYEGNYYLKARDKDSDQEVNIKLTGTTANSIGEWLYNKVGNEGGSAAREIRAAAEGMMGIGAASELANMANDSYRKMIGNDPRILQNPATGNKLEVYKAPNGMFALGVRDKNGNFQIAKRSDGTKHRYSSEQDLNINYILPMQQRLANQ